MVPSPLSTKLTQGRANLEWRIRDARFSADLDLVEGITMRGHAIRRSADPIGRRRWRGPDGAELDAI